MSRNELPSQQNQELAHDGSIPPKSYRRSVTQIVTEATSDPQMRRELLRYAYSLGTVLTAEPESRKRERALEELSGTTYWLGALNHDLQSREPEIVARNLRGMKKIRRAARQLDHPS